MANQNGGFQNMMPESGFPLNQDEPAVCRRYYASLTAIIIINSHTRTHSHTHLTSFGSVSLLWNWGRFMFAPWVSRVSLDSARIVWAAGS